MVNPSTESILNQMTNLAMDIALDYVLPASPMSDVCKSDLFEFEREVVAAAVNGDLMNSLLVSSTAGIAGGCCGRPPTDLCKKNSYMGAAGCDSCDACLARRSSAVDTSSSSYSGAGMTPSSTPSSTTATVTTTTRTSSSSTPPPSLQPQTAETTMDISWCQFDGCEFDTADNSYLDICDWIFYADRYALTDENREKVQKAFQMVPPGEVTGYVAEPPQQQRSKPTKNNGTSNAVTVGRGVTVKSEPTDVKSEPDDDYLWTSDHHLQPIILKAEPNADILQITELDHSYLQTVTNSSTVVSPVKHNININNNNNNSSSSSNHHNHLVDMLGLVTPPPSRSQSSEEEEIDVVNDSWDTPDPPRKGATMADIMKRGIVKKRDPPVTKWKNTVKRKYKTAGGGTAAAAYHPMPPPPPKKMCSGGLSLLDRYKKDTNWKDVAAAAAAAAAVVKEEPRDAYVKQEPVDDDVEQQQQPSLHRVAAATVKPEPLDEDYDEDDEYDMDADFESLMKNEPEDMFDDDYDDYDDENDIDWDKVLRNNVNSGNSTTGGRGHHDKSFGGSSSCGSSSSSSSSSSSGGGNAGRKKKKKKKKKKKAANSSSSSKSSSSKHHHHPHHHHYRHLHHQSSSSSSSPPSSVAGKKIKYEPGTVGGYSYKTKLMDPVKRALHNDLEKSRRVETSMLFMNLSMQVSFLDDNRKIPSKLSILRGAKRECDLTMLEERRLVSEKQVMQQKQRMLRERLFELRREQYHRRYGKNTPKQQQQQQQQQQRRQ